MSFENMRLSSIKKIYDKFGVIVLLFTGDISIASDFTASSVFILFNLVRIIDFDCTFLSLSDGIKFLKFNSLY
jgi:hypothetical protein